MISRIFLVVTFLLPYNFVQAQHSIDIQKLTAQGQHFEALVQYEKMAKRRATAEAIISSAKSAWALGLVDRAIAAFEDALRLANLSNESRARLLLSRGVIEFQEQRYQIAVLFAERAVKALPVASALRAKAYLLWGESLFASDSTALALEKYQLAIDQNSNETLADANFLIGRCLVRMGRYADAEKHLEAVPVNHDRTPESIRLLALAALETGKYEGVDFWLGRGREHYSDQFLDSWVDFALVSAALKRGDNQRAQELLQAAEKRYPPSDDWLNLAQAALETNYWQAKAQAKDAAFNELNESKTTDVTPVALAKEEVQQ